MQGGAIVVKLQQWFNNSSASSKPNKEKIKVELTIHTASNEQKDIRREIAKCVEVLLHEKLVLTRYQPIKSDDTR